MGIMKIAGGALIALFVVSCIGSMTASREERGRADADALAAENRRAVCEKALPGLLAEHERLMAAKNYKGAFEVISDCTVTLKSPELSAQYKRARALWNLSVVTDMKADGQDRLDSLKVLRSSDPASAASFEKLGSQLEASIEAARAREAKKQAAAEAARRKKEGVRIGMSKADVVASSWGRPEKINTTTNAYGTREQWVYDGGYLYFENGVLTTIQN